MAMDGATIGRLGILQVDAATNQACCAISPSKDIDTVFLFYSLIPKVLFLSNSTNFIRTIFRHKRA